MNLRPVGGIQRQQSLVRLPPGYKIRIGRVVAIKFVLDEMPHHVDAKTVDTAPQPEPHHVRDRPAHLRVAPVQVRLLAQERMVIILATLVIELPGTAAELGDPVGRRPAVRTAITPDVPIAFRIIRRTAALNEPGMLVRGVIGNQVENELQVVGVRGRHQRIEIRERAEQRIDPDIVGNVVAEIHHRRGKDRRQPQRLNAELAQIRQPLDDTTEVADAVAIGILKRTRIDLIEDAGLPPGNVIEHACAGSRVDQNLFVCTYRFSGRWGTAVRFDGPT